MSLVSSGHCKLVSWEPCRLVSLERYMLAS